MPVHRGVYRAKGAPHTEKSRIMAAVLACGPGAVASHTSALWLFGLPTFGRNLPHVSVARGPLERPGIITHQLILPENHKTAIDRIPVTCVERALIDASAVLARWQLSKVANEAAVRGLTTYKQIQSVLEQVGRQGRKGTGILRKLVTEHLPLPLTDSPLTQRFLHSLMAANLPMPVLEYRVVANGREYFLDAAWPDIRMAIEIDDFGSHGKSRKRFDNDRRRNNYLAIEGWTLQHVTSAMRDAEFIAAVLPFLKR